MARKRADSVLELIGQTPLIRLPSFERGGAELWAKVEFANPGGSVKDRIALSMLEGIEKRGLLKPGQGTVVEPTSGNTGIGLAMICAVKGWRCIIVMPEGLPPRRMGLLKAYGAEIVLSPFELGMSGAIERAEALLREHPDWVMPMQFANQDNPAAHRQHTGPEIWKALDGEVHAGVGQYLKRKNPALKLVAMEPALSAVLSGQPAGAHRIVGIGAGFVPAVLDRDLIDSIVTVTDSEAVEGTTQLARREGLLAGISAGANVFAAAKIAAAMPAGQRVVTILCDGGSIYLDDDGGLS
jgi:cysteine synthase A